MSRLRERIHHSWEHLQQSRPGRRFQDWHRRHRDRHPHRQGHNRAVLALVGTLAIIAGLVMMVTPGPGLLGLGLGAALLALVSRRVARLLDRLELHTRRGARWGERWWRQCTPGQRTIFVFSVLVILTTVAYHLLRWLLDSGLV